MFHGGEITDFHLPLVVDFKLPFAVRKLGFKGQGAFLIPAKRSLTYIDLSMFQLIAGLRYALPRMMSRVEKQLPGLVVLHERISQRTNLAAYLASQRRIPFNQDGIFRHYPELDG